MGGLIILDGLIWLLNPPPEVRLKSSGDDRGGGWCGARLRPSLLLPAKGTNVVTMYDTFGKQIIASSITCLEPST